jgi:hypothetical protein
MWVVHRVEKLGHQCGPPRKVTGIQTIDLQYGHDVVPDPSVDVQRGLRLRRRGEGKLPQARGGLGSGGLESSGIDGDRSRC